MQKILKFILVFIIFSALPIFVYADNLNEITYNDAKVSFTIDEDEWKRTDLSEEREYIDRKWIGDCGVLITGSYDVYDKISTEELDGLTREYFNYKNLFTTDEFAESMISGVEEIYSVDNWSYESYKMKFISINGSGFVQNGVWLNYHTYMTINNGYIVTIQYVNTRDIEKYSCISSIDNIVSSAESMINVKETGSNDIKGTSIILYFIFGLIITAVSYIGYPFTRVIFMKKKYKEKEAKRMILWNSVIVGIIFLIITASTNKNTVWSASPAVFYYFINKSLWVNNIKRKNAKKKNTESLNNDKKLEKDLGDAEPVEYEETTEKFTSLCSNCGEEVKNSDKKCLKCGEKNNGYNGKEENKTELSDMDKKYADLVKLNVLLNKDIISKEEFEKEKRKILNKK